LGIDLQSSSTRKQKVTEFKYIIRIIKVQIIGELKMRHQICYI